MVTAIECISANSRSLLPLIIVVQIVKAAELWIALVAQMY
jgi:hypothetical protein